MGVPEYSEGQVRAMIREADAEAELGRADEPLSPDSYGPGLIPGLRPWEYPLPKVDEPPSDRDWIGPVYPSGEYVPLAPAPFVCVPTAELAGNTGTTLGEFFFWGENLDEDDYTVPDYLAITRDVAGG